MVVSVECDFDTERLTWKESGASVGEAVASTQGSSPLSCPKYHEVKRVETPNAARGA